ncbi:MAG: hypothetical protein Kow00106_17020 [Anaerolineae bacterium]
MPCAFRASLPAGQLLTAVCRALTAAGFQVAKSFDLRSAFAVLPDHACPQHGPAECDCQYCVLLVYGRTAAPGILIVHGSDARGWITLADPWLGPTGPAPIADIVRALAEAHLINLASDQEDM